MITRRILHDLIRRRLQKVLDSPELAGLMKEMDRLEEAWEELSVENLKSDFCPAASCIECWLEEELGRGSEIKLYRRNGRTAPFRGTAEAVIHDSESGTRRTPEYASQG